MKFLGSLFTFAVVGICSAFAKPDINQEDDTFRYWISDTNYRAMVTGVKDKYATDITLNPYVVVEGKRYYVNQIAPAAFTNTYVQNINIGSNIESIHINYQAFNNANYIRTITLDTNKVTADADAFNACGTYIGFSGRGTESLINDYSKNLLRSWGLPVNKDYTNISDFNRKQALYKLAKIVHDKFHINDKVAYPSNVASVLALKQGNYLGIARAFRVLALNMGFQYNDVHVGGDNYRFYWNYVYVNLHGQKRWYNLDIVHSDFPESYRSKVFADTTEQRKVLEDEYRGSHSVNPDDWVIFNNQYGYPGERKYYPELENFNDWLVRNRAGIRDD